MQLRAAAQDTRSRAHLDDQVDIHDSWADLNDGVVRAGLGQCLPGRPELGECLRGLGAGRSALWWRELRRRRPHDRRREELADPPRSPAQTGGAVDCFQVACVTNLRFASSAVGYLFGPALLLTTDGGHTWRAQPGPDVETLTVAAGHVFRVVYDHSGCPGPCDPSLQAAGVGAVTWRTVIGRLAYPGRSNSAQIVASGQSLLVALYGSRAGPVSAQAVLYRSTDAGASWQQRADPCSGRGPEGSSQEEDLINLANAPGGFFAGLCSPHVGTGAFVVSSYDAGGSWRTAGSLPADQDIGLLAASSATTLAAATGPIGGAGSVTARLLVSTDGGRHWTTAAGDTQPVAQGGIPAWLGFETASVGRWVGDPHSIWTTVDGGLHWTQAGV